MPQIICVTFTTLPGLLHTTLVQDIRITTQMNKNLDWRCPHPHENVCIRYLDFGIQNLLSSSGKCFLRRFVKAANMRRTITSVFRKWDATKNGEMVWLGNYRICTGGVGCQNGIFPRKSLKKCGKKWLFRMKIRG